MPPPYYECQADKENLGEIGCELAINLPMPPRQINRTLHFLGSKEPAAQKRKQKGHIYLTYEPINKVTYMVHVAKHITPTAQCWKPALKSLVFLIFRRKKKK